MKKWHKLAALCIALFVLVGVLGCLAESFIERRRAEELLNVLANVQIGAMHKPILDEKLERFRRYRSSNGSSGGRSYEQFMFRNYGFALFHLAPAKDIWIQIDYNNGRVVEKSAHFAEAPNRGAMLTETSDVEGTWSSNPQVAHTAREVVERGAFTSPSYMLAVRDNTSAPANRLRTDWNIDISCMTRLGPCGDFRKILWGAFK